MLIVNSKWAISIDKAKMNFMPMLWEEERMVKNLKTGEESLKEAQWTYMGDYYPNVAQALRGIMKYEI